MHPLCTGTNIIFGNKNSYFMFIFTTDFYKSGRPEDGLRRSGEKPSVWTGLFRDDNAAGR